MQSRIYNENDLTEKEKLQSVIETLQMQNINYISKCAKLEEYVKQLEYEIENKKKMIIEKGEENRRIKQKLEDVYREKNALLNSKWYRITKPGRAIIRFLRKVFSR